MQSCRKRSTNFSDTDVNLFLELMNDSYIRIIEDKRSDSKTIKRKHDTWVDLTHEFNAQSVSNREIDSLKNLWKRLKSDAKSKDAANRREIRKTGGGVSDINLSPKSMRIKEMLPVEQMQPSLISEFDSDAAAEQSRPGGFVELLQSDTVVNGTSQPTCSYETTATVGTRNCKIQKTMDCNQPKGTLSF